MERSVFANAMLTDKATRKTSGLSPMAASTSLSDYWRVTPARFHHALRRAANLNTLWCQGQRSVRIGPVTLGLTPFRFSCIPPTKSTSHTGSRDRLRSGRCAASVSDKSAVRSFVSDLREDEEPTGHCRIRGRVAHRLQVGSI